MLSRRRYLQAQLLGLAPFLWRSDISAFPPTPGSIPPEDGGERDYWNDWPRYLTAKMNEARARRRAVLGAMRTEADVRARSEKTRSTVWQLLGGSFEKTPLKPRIVGKIDRSVYRIEKVIFESQPEVFVTSNLYLPTQLRPPFPGIILPLGHAPEGKLHRSYQYVAQTLARTGYVVLAFDPFGQGERLQYLDERTGKGLFSPTGEHSQAGRPMLLMGSQFAQYLVWDGIRAVDFLVSRPEVDSQRIGCTGQSGGGTMTMYMAALEPRIKAAVASDANSENLAGPSYAPPGAIADAEQNIVGSLPEGIDRGDLLLAFAPNPLLVLYSQTDSGFTYSPTYAQGTKEVYEELQGAYKLMGAADKVRLYGSPMPHDFDFFNRQETYRWFNRWLRGEDSATEEAEFDDSAPEALNCTSTGQVLTSLGGRSVVQLNTERLRAVAPSNPVGATPDDARAFRARAQAILPKLLALPAERTPLRAQIISSNIRKGVVVEEFVFESEPSVRVPGWFLHPARGEARLPTVVYVSEGARHRVMYETSEIGALARMGFAVCAVDLRGLGSSIPHNPAAGPAFYTGMPPREAYPWACFTLGKPVLGQRVWDYLRCLDYLSTRPEVDPQRIHGLGEGGAALAVLLSAVLDGRLHSVMLDSLVATYRSLVTSKVYALDFSWFLYGVLKQFDLPDLVGSLVPRRCWILNATNPRGEPIPESEISQLYQYPMKIYEELNAGGQFRFMTFPAQEKSKAITSWLQAD